MSFQLQTEQMPGYLAAKFIGSGETSEGLRQFESIAEHCKLTKNDKLLIDTTGFDVRMSVTSGYFAGEKAEIFARHGIKKVAFVGSPEQLPLGKFSILVARNRFINVEAFSDFQAAEEWLMK
jgi:hypothetical protein